MPRQALLSSDNHVNMLRQSRAKVALLHDCSSCNKATAAAFQLHPLGTQPCQLTNARLLQEPEVLYALPEDRLAAWFYMHALVCANPHMVPWMSSQLKNAGMHILVVVHS